MLYAIDLNPRQCARTLKQAMRHQASVELEPRQWTGGLPLVGQLENAEADGSENPQSPLLAVTIHQPAASRAPDGGHAAPDLDFVQRLTKLVGSYCDVVITLGENRYLCSSDIAKIESVPDSTNRFRLYVSRPETMQVAQRRKFWRFRPAKSAQVELRWGDESSPSGAVAWMCNVSGDGLACRVDQRIGEQLWIGDQLLVKFALAPGDPQHYSISAVLCNKTPAGSEGKLILGLQFLTGPEFEDNVRAAELLRHHLMAHYGTLADTREGADA